MYYGARSEGQILKHSHIVSATDENLRLFEFCAGVENEDPCLLSYFLIDTVVYIYRVHWGNSVYVYNMYW